MTTRLVAIRHAKPLSEGYAEDSLRPLAEEGKAVQRIVTQKIKEGGIKPDVILCSPLLRAQQTAEIIGETFDIPVQDELALGDQFDSHKLLDFLPPPDHNQTIVFVGHAPTLAEFVNQLVGEVALPNGLSKSEAAVVEFDNTIGFGKGKFIGVYQP